jgi:acyl-CoA synthetase (AMP-forming)/AMP-acid ligase II
MKTWFGHTSADVSLHLVPHHLAHGIKSALMVPLLAGTSIVCPPEFRVDAFYRLIEEYRPTWFTAGFSVHREILRGVDRYRDIVDRTNLRFLRSGSGKLEPDEIMRLEDAFRAPMVIPLSSTETCLIAASPLPPRQRKPGSVGLPVVNEVAIRGEDGSLLGPDEEGEIVVRGPLVFDGYLDDPALTERAFVDGWYRTGDVGKRDGEGYLYLTGRIKDVINRGGEKIAPAEIDAVLQSHPAVAEAAAFGMPHPTLGELVVAAVVPRPGARLDEKALRQHVRARLAPTKVPSRIFVVDSLPRTEGGKLRRSELREALTP